MATAFCSKKLTRFVGKLRKNVILWRDLFFDTEVLIESIKTPTFQPML